MFGDFLATIPSFLTTLEQTFRTKQAASESPGWYHNTARMSGRAFFTPEA